MKTFKGTQAPWVFIETEMKIYGDKLGGFYSACIADVGTHRNLSRGMNTQRANAKLIAAAPELLDVVLEFVNRYVDLTEGENNLIDKAREAINKAL